MRKLKKGTIGLIIATVALILGVFGAFGAVTISKSKNKEEAIEISTNTIIYNNSSNPIKISSDGSITKEGKKYVAKLNDGKTYDLGEHSMVYSGRTLRILGGAYQITKDGDIYKVDDSFEFNNFADGSIFKLCDRKYVLASSIIEDSKKSFESQESFMYIIMDTVGNAKLSSSKITLRSTEPTILNTANFIFDVANEILEISEIELHYDLGKLIGSTVTYDPNKYKTIDEDDTPADIVVDIYGGNGGNGGDGADGGNGANGGNGGDGADGGNGGNGADGGNGGNGADGGDGGSGGIGQEQEVVAYIVNKKIAVTSTTLTCDYYYLDPFGKLGAIYIELHEYSLLPDAVKNKTVSMNEFVVDEEGLFEDYWNTYNNELVNRYECNFYDKQTTFRGLKPNTTYVIFLCRYYENSTTEETEFELIDVAQRTTLPYQNKVNVTLLGSNYFEVDITLESLEPQAFKVMIANTAYEELFTEQEKIQAVESKITKRITITGETEFMKQTEFVTIQVIDNEGNVICETYCRNNFYEGNTI